MLRHKIMASAVDQAYNLHYSKQSLVCL